MPALRLAVKLGLAIPAVALLLAFVTVGCIALGHAWQPGYASPGIPVWFFGGAALSVLGMNTEVLADGHNAFMCTTEADWYAALRRLRATLGTAARRTIVERYSMASNAANFLALFDAATPPRP